MFFRRPKPHNPSFQERLENLRRAGFQVNVLPQSGVQISRGGCVAVVEDSPGNSPIIRRTGILVGSEIGTLVDVGYQKIFRTMSGKRVPAQAAQLKALHAFTEDLREELGLSSLYNESLGTVNANHLYDRVEDRDQGVPDRPWQRSH